MTVIFTNLDYNDFQRPYLSHTVSYGRFFINRNNEFERLQNSLVQKFTWINIFGKKAFRNIINNDMKINAEDFLFVLKLSFIIGCDWKMSTKQPFFLDMCYSKLFKFDIFFSKFFNILEVQVKCQRKQLLSFIPFVHIWTLFCHFNLKKNRKFRCTYSNERTWFKCHNIYEYETSLSLVQKISTLVCN